MVGKRTDGDLFPRGAAQSSTPRIRKRDGSVLFTPESSKKARLERAPETPQSKESSVIRSGVSLSYSRLSVGMTVLGIVTRSNSSAIHLSLPNGLVGFVSVDEILVEFPVSETRSPFGNKASQPDSDTDDDISTSDEEDDEEDNNRQRPLWELLTVGSIVPAAVLDIVANNHGRKHVSLSLKPELINVGLNPARLLKKGFGAYAVVRTVEDHGYTVSFGTNIVHTGFLPFKKAENPQKVASDNPEEDTRLHVGYPIEVVTTKDTSLPKGAKGNYSAVVHVSSIRAKLLKAEVQHAESLQYQDLRAGMLLKATVTKEGSGGVLLSLGGIFDIAVDSSHVPRKNDGSGDVTKGKSKLVRLLYVDPSQKRIVGSLLNSLVRQMEPRVVPSTWKIGTFLEKLVVQRVKHDGLLLRYLPPSSDDEKDENDETEDIDNDEDQTEDNTVTSIPIQVHLSRISDTIGMKLDSKFHQGMELSTGARIVGISRLDGSVSVDMRSSILSRKALSLDELEIGELYDCKIMSHTANGNILVAIEGDSRLIGIIQKLHVSDVPLPAKKLSNDLSLRPGASIRCRVLSVQLNKERVFLTARKSLITPKHPLLTSHEQAEKALKISKNRGESTMAGETEQSIVFTGSVSSVSDNSNVIVEFCNRVRGLVRYSELPLGKSRQGSKPSKSEVEQFCPVGDTVHVRLMQVDSKNRRMLLSMNLAADKSNDHQFCLGQKVSGCISGCNEDGKYFIVEVDSLSTSPEDSTVAKSKRKKKQSKGKPVRCHLPFGHLSDVLGMADRLHEDIKKKIAVQSKSNDENMVTIEAMVMLFQHDIPILTMKPSLIQAASEKLLPQSFDEVKAFYDRQNSSEEKPGPLRGYVKAILPAALIIGFLGDVVGIVRISRIANYFVSDPNRAMKLNQSVSAAVETIETGLKRFSLSLRRTEVGDVGTIQDTLSFFRSTDSWQKFLNRHNEEKDTHIGSVQEGTVSAVNTYGVTYNLNHANSHTIGVALELKETTEEIESLEENLSNYDNSAHKKSENNKKGSDAPKEGTLEKVRVLDVDPLSGVFDLTRNSDIVNGGTKKSVLANEAKLQATVLLVKSAYIILAVRRSKTRSAIAFALGPTIFDKFKLRPGMTVTCTVLDKTQAGTRRNLVLIDWDSYQRGSSTIEKGAKLNDDNKNTGVAMLKRTAAEDESAVVGIQVKGKVTRLLSIGAYVGIGPGVVGHIHQVHLAHLTPEEKASFPLGIFPKELQTRYALPEVGRVIDPLFVTNVNRAPVESGPLVVELAMLKDPNQNIMEEGNQVIGIVKNLSTMLTDNTNSKGNASHFNSTLVAISPTRTVSCADVDCLFEKSGNKINTGTPVKCLITKASEEPTGRLQGALSENGRDQNEPFLGIIRSVIKGVGVQISVPWLSRHKSAKEMSWGFVGLCDVANDFDIVHEKLEAMNEGDIVKVMRVGDPSKAPSKQEPICLTMRVENNKKGEKDALLHEGDVSKLTEGQTVRGFVRRVANVGCFVTIGRDLTAQVKLHDLANEYVKDPEKRFPIGTLVSGKIGKTDNINGKKRLTLILRTRPRANLKASKTDPNLREGTQVHATVKRIEEYGAILELDQGISALLHKKEADQDRFISNTHEEWVVGQKLHAILIKVEEGKLKVGTKRCYFEAAGLDESTIDGLLQQNEQSRISKKADNANDEIVAMDIEEKAEIDEDESGSSDDTPFVILDNDNEEDSDEEMEDVLPLEAKQASAPPLKISDGFDFSGQETNMKVNKEDEESSEEESEEDENDEKNIGGKSKTDKDEEQLSKRTSKDKREKRRLREAAEREIQLREESLANNPDSPETADDFERMLMSEPSSSVLWIRYMGFCISLSQVEKARAVAERALETIKLEAEVDRVNIWIAYINLESSFGSINSEAVSSQDNIKRDAAVYRIFDRGCERVTDVESFHLRVAAALEKSNPPLADGILKKATKKFKTSKQVWIDWGTSLFKRGKRLEARNTLDKALERLEKRDHVAVISKFAQLEYKHGSVERGRTIFESLVGNFPKRLDFWNIYLDMEENQCRNVEGDDSDKRSQMIERTRGLFERCSSLDLSSKKMKFALKRWLSFEKSFGTKEDQLVVKQKARDYVEKSVGAVQQI